MNPPHIVFVDSTVAGLPALKKAKDMGCRVTFVEPLDSSFLQISKLDASLIRQHLACVDHHVKLPELSQGVLTKTIREFSQSYSVDAVITTSEAAILPVAQSAEELCLRTPGRKALEQAVFKDQCRQALQKAGLRSPKFEILSEEQLIGGQGRALKAPLVVKPTRGFGKQFSAVCRTEDELNTFVQSLARIRAATDPMINLIVNRNYILEEYVEGSLHSAEVVVVDGHAQIFATTTRFRSSHSDLLEVGYCMPASLKKDRQIKLEQYVSQVFAAVGIQFGLYHVELIDSPAGPCLVEINGRIMGGAGPQVYRSVSGKDAFELLIRIHLGEPVKSDHLAIQGAATVLLIGAKEQGTVAACFTQQGLDDLLARYGIHFCTLALKPGMTLRKFEGNLSALGHVIVPGDNVGTSNTQAHAFLNELDSLLGCEISKLGA
jgi:biotin carboxylase